MDINYSAIHFDHFVEFTKDDCVFGAGREKANNRTRLFLIINHTGRVYSRNGRTDAWETVGQNEETLIREQAASAKQSSRYFTTNAHFTN